MKIKFGIWVICLLISLSAAAARAEEDEASDLAKKTQNPVANLVSVPFQDNLGFSYGPNAKQLNVLNVQPVLPFELNKDWNLITRTILPIVSSPWPKSINGTGDLVESLFLSPSGSKQFIWGAGPVLQFPTGSDQTLTTGKLGAGPTAVALFMGKKFVPGVLINNIWSYAGQQNRAQTSMMTLQPFINYNLEHGMYFTTSPIMTANWWATSNNRWTVPVGIGFGKLSFLGKLPINASISYYNNIVRPDYGPLWTLRTQIQILLPKFY